MPTGIQQGDKIAVLLDSKTNARSTPYEKKICKCISYGFEKLKKEVEVVHTEEFRGDSLLDNKLAKSLSNQAAVYRILDDPLALKQIERLGIHYIVLVNVPVTDKQVHSTSDLEWASGGYPGPVPVPIYTYSRTTRVSIEITGYIFDFKERRKSGEVIASSEGESYLGVMAPIPIGWPSGVSQSQACKEFGKAVAEFIIGEEVEK